MWFKFLECQYICYTFLKNFYSSTEDTPITIDSDNVVRLIGTDGNPTDSTTIDAIINNEKVGEYTFNKSTGEVTFVPNANFIGSPNPAKVQVYNYNGTTAIAEYQPRVTSIPTDVGQFGVERRKALKIGLSQKILTQTQVLNHCR